MTRKKKYLISPNIDNHILTQKITGVDQDSNPTVTKVIQERSLTIFLNNQEIVTLMSIPDYPRYLAVGYLLNQNMLKKNDIIRSIKALRQNGIEFLDVPDIYYDNLIDRVGSIDEDLNQLKNTKNLS